MSEKKAGGRVYQGEAAVRGTCLGVRRVAAVTAERPAPPEEAEQPEISEDDTGAPGAPGSRRADETRR